MAGESKVAAGEAANVQQAENITTSDTGDEGFNRGLYTGRVYERLGIHDQQFAHLTDSMGSVVAEVAGLTLAVQRLGDQAQARDATTLATASALKNADEARRQKADGAWAPLTKFFGVASLILTLIVVWMGYLASLK